MSTCSSILFLLIITYQSTEAIWFPYESNSKVDIPHEIQCLNTESVNRTKSIANDKTSLLDQEKLVGFSHGGLAVTTSSVNYRSTQSNQTCNRSTIIQRIAIGK
ncbi:hypothetical protein QQ045_007203 [Rhodiola kirilowii]